MTVDVSKSNDERRFINKHKVEKTPYPVDDTDDQFTGNIKGGAKRKKRLADVSDNDEGIYEWNVTFHDTEETYSVFARNKLTAIMEAKILLGIIDSSHIKDVERVTESTNDFKTRIVSRIKSRLGE